MDRTMQEGSVAIIDKEVDGQKTEERQLPPPRVQDEEPSTVKVSFNVAPHQVATLRQLSRNRGVSMTEVLRHAIELENFITTELSRDDVRIIVENTKDHTRKELVFLGP